jgi:serine/threonine-protein kinase ATR
MTQRCRGWLLLACTLLAQPAGAGENAPHVRRPAFRDFMGLCTHTVQFKPALYAPVCRLARDYHPFDWDVGDDTSSAPPFPFARNGVNWAKVYGGWKAGGFEPDVSLLFARTKARQWKDPARDARAYGRAFAKAFGPSSPRGLVPAVEVGNEPGHYGDRLYRTLLENMATGLKEGDSRIRVGTCALTAGASDRYARSVRTIKGLEGRLDFLTIHAYAQVEGWPTWRRSYPEDPKIDYLRRVEDLLAWRDRYAPGKEVWVTEFGWDASSKPAPKTGTFRQWVGNSEAEQARYLVRSFLLFARRGVARAYIYFFDDKDEPQVHGSSGLTRRSKPKPAYYAVAHLYRTLGAYRCGRVLLERIGRVYAYEFVHAKEPGRRVWAVWSPTGKGRTGRVELPLGGWRCLGRETMPLAAGKVPREPVTLARGGVVVEYGESPVYLFLRAAEKGRK